jgi:methionyl-tRNA synthetase
VIKNDPERVKTILNISLQITANLAIILDPFLPFSMMRLREGINSTESRWSMAGSDSLLPEGHKINTPSLLFRRIEDDEIEREVNRLLQTKKDNKDNNSIAAPAKENITFDDFSRLDIRTATIKEAVKVPKTKKLLKLTLDTGIDHRTVVSGIAEYFEPEAIVGRQVAVVVNLAPRNIKGIESQGMILMAEDKDGKLVFVQPSDRVSDGSGIK